jgi:hypothetical protein
MAGWDGKWRTASMAGLAGLVLAGAALWGGSVALERAAEVEPFRVEVAAPHAVAGEARWRGQVRPETLGRRVRVSVDGREVEGSSGQVTEDMPEGAFDVDLDDAAGLRLVEVELARRGGRTEVITDAALVGPFARRYEDVTGCGAAVRVAGAAIERLVMPPLRERLLAAARGVALLGPDTQIEQAEVTLRDGSVWFRVALAGAHRIAISGRIAVRVAGPRHLGLTLATLGPVEFSGTLRTRATVGAAALGAVVTGPFAPVGAFAGYMLADRYIDRRSQREVETQLSAALSIASTLPLVPESAELVLGEPRSRAALAFCAVAIEDGGIAASLSLRPVRPEPKDRQEAERVRTRLAAIPGPARRGFALPELRPVAPAGDVEVDLTIDAIDALLDAWTANGLLADLVARARWVERADAELQAWTSLGLSAVEVRLPPSLSPGTGDGWALQLAGLRLEMIGVEHEPGEILVAGRGTVRPHYDEARGRIELTGAIERLTISCARDGALWPCFGALLELGDVPARLDELLAPGAAGLPGIEVRELVRARTTEIRADGLELAGLTISYPAAGVLRVAARVE